MNRREDPLLREHRSRLMQLVEVTNIRPGRGNGKRRGLQHQRTGGSASNGGGVATNNRGVTLQDIVRSDPGYTSNIEHLVFPERKNSNPNLNSTEGESPPRKTTPLGNSSTSSSSMSRIAEVFVRSYARGSSQDSSVAATTSRKNHVNSSSLDGGARSQQSSAVVTTPVKKNPRGTNGERRWLVAQNCNQKTSQPARQLSAEEAVALKRGENLGGAKAPWRLSPSVDSGTEHSGPTLNAARSTERGPNISVLHLRDSNTIVQVNQQSTQYASVPSSSPMVGKVVGKVSTKASPNPVRTGYVRGSTVPGHHQNLVSRSDLVTNTSNPILPKPRSIQDQNYSMTRRREDSFLSGSGGTSGELFASGNCSRELSPVRWCDREVDGVYLGRSGWVQVQQRSLDENRKTNYESSGGGGGGGGGGSVTTSTPLTGTLPMSRRGQIKLADYHCSKSEPGVIGKVDEYSFTTAISSRPDYLALHGNSPGYDSPPPVNNSPRRIIPESFSPPSITPIISPPPAFQDSATTTTRKSSARHGGRKHFFKPPFLPRSNAIVDSDVISPPPSPQSPNPGTRINPSSSSSNQQQPYRLAQAKSLEDQSGARRTQFVQRYKDSSSSSSSSLGFRSLDSCVNRGQIAMPRLAENTDSSIEGYEDGDEDDNPSSSLNLSVLSSAGINSSPDSLRNNQINDKVSPSGRARASQQHNFPRGQNQIRRSPGSSESSKQLNFNSPLSSSSTSSLSGNEQKGRSPSNTFRNPRQQQQQQQQQQQNSSTRCNNNNNLNSSPDSMQSRVRRSRSLQLPERKSPGSLPQNSSSSSSQSREQFRESNEPTHRVIVKIANTDRSKRNFLPSSRKAQSTDSALNDELLREAEVVTEFLYGNRNRGSSSRSLLTSRNYDRRSEDSSRDSSLRRGGNSGSYEVYFVPSSSSSSQHHQQSHNQGKPMTKHLSQQHRVQRPRTLQRGCIVGDISPEDNPETGIALHLSPETKARCNSSTCSFWPYCSQRDTHRYSPTTLLTSGGSMKTSQSYPAAQNRLSLDSSGQQLNSVGKNSASSSPASLEQVDEREPNSRSREKRNTNKQKSVITAGKSSRRSPAPSTPIESQTKPSPSLGPGSSASSSSSSSSDIWVTTSDRTVTKSPRNAKSSGASTPMEDAIIGSFVTLAEVNEGERNLVTRPGSAPAQREDSSVNDSTLDPHQRSLSLPKSFLAHNALPLMESGSSNAGSTPWHRGFESQRSTPSPKLHYVKQETEPPPHTAPVSPLHEQLSGNGLRERRRTAILTKAERRAKASSTPALLDRDQDQDGRQWSTDEGERGSVVHGSSVEHPVVEASIPLVSQIRIEEGGSQFVPVGSLPHERVPGIQQQQQQQQQQQLHRQNLIQATNQGSVLKKFRKSLSLRFNKKGGSKESSEGGDPPSEDSSGAPLDEDEDREPPPPPAPQQHTSMQNKDEQPINNDQKFRFGPLVWRTSKERKKTSKASRNAKCNSGDSGIQIEMVSGVGSSSLTSCAIGGSGGVLTGAGAGDSSESHDTDAQDDIDSPPALRRRVNDKSRPKSELVNQILIDKFKADLQTRGSGRHYHVRRTNSDLGGQRLLQWDTRSGYSQAHNYRRMLSTPSPIKTRPPRLSPRHSNSNDIVTLRSGNSKGRNSRTNLRRSLSQPLGINKLSPLMRAKTSGARLPGGNVLSEDEQDPRFSGGGECGGGTSEDEMMSDSESSVASLTDRKKPFEQTMDENVAILAEAVWDHVAIEPEELAFRAGDVIDVLDTIDRDWWWGSCRNEHGWFPAAFVRLRVSQEDTVEDCLAAMASGMVSSSSQLRRRTSVSLLSNEQVRTSVVRELVQTERDFVKILRDVAEGYIAECRRRVDMFSEEQIETIFINIEELLDFQSEFLKDLVAVIDWDAPHKSCVGECFLNHRAGFRMYSEYCNSHPMAIATLQELYQHNRYSKFFEGCRLMRGLIEIPLDGYLLTPVQRICKYPLQLAELLKYTKSDHPDYDKIREALEAMRGVAVLINERKRRMESLEKLASWQQRVEGWEAEDLIEVSSQLIHQGEVIRVTSGMWTNNITLFLFDHQLVYCKKDLLKRNTYVYKGRIYLDTSEVIDVPDGKDPQLGVTVRHCLKVYSCVRDKWLLFCCRTAEEKRKWLSAMAEERRLVEQDRNDGLDFPHAARQLAKISATRERCRPPSKPSNKSYKRNSAYEVPILPLSQHQHQQQQQNNQHGGGTNSLGRKVGTWFTFGSNKKGPRPGPTQQPHSNQTAS